MPKSQPVVYDWKTVEVVNDDGEIERVRAMVPAKKYRGIANKLFREGGEYALAPIERRNMRFHNWYFAQLTDIYETLPEKTEAQFQALGIRNFDHFRSWCLIRTNWYNLKVFNFAGDQKHRHRSAMRLMKFIRIEDYAEFEMSEDSIVTGKYAKSQKVEEMEPEDFKASAMAVLELAGDMVGVSPAQMRRHAAQHA